MVKINPKKYFFYYFILFVIIILMAKSVLVLAQEEIKNSPQVAQNQEVKTANKSSRDPMVPIDMSIFETTPKKSITKRSPFKVQGIGRGSEEGAFVIIGGKVYREGETKGEITVVKITGTEVDILVNGSPETLAVKEK